MHQVNLQRLGRAAYTLAKDYLVITHISRT
jgi:hypothetical protein